jgi:hypothetical protein
MLAYSTHECFLANTRVWHQECGSATVGLPTLEAERLSYLLNGLLTGRFTY